MPLSSLLSETWETIWQAALVKLPRAVPTAALKYTSPEGPYPFILDLPSRDFGNHTIKHGSKRTIPVYIFLPPLTTLDNATPDLSAAADPPRLDLPVMVDFHGGGFFMGSCLEQAPFCSLMARKLNCVVISVDYRMAPIDKFPAAVHDAEDILRCILDPTANGARELAKSVELRCADAFARARAQSRRRSRSQSRASSRASSRRSSPVSDTTAEADVALADPVSGRKQKKKSAKSGANGGKQSREPSPRKQHNKLTKSRSVSPVSPAPIVALDRTRVAVSGFSSGGNLALNAVVNVPGGSPLMDKDWPCPFPDDYAHSIPTLLYYPAVDLQQLPSERLLPAGMIKSDGLWARLSDNLAPSYCPRDKTQHWRASPGLADPAKDLHPAAKVLLVQPGRDNLADQCEQWAVKVRASGRGDDLQCEPYPIMKHGWTQFPESFLDEEQKRTRMDIFDKTIEFVRRSWYDGRSGV